MPTKTLILTSIAPGTDELTVTLSEGKNYTGAEAKLGVEVSVLPKADPVFENNSWETIAAYAAAGKASETWNVGDRKPFTISGTIYYFQIGDFDHDDLDPSDSAYNNLEYNGGKNKAAITLIMEGTYSTSWAMNSTYTSKLNYGTSQMRKTRLPYLKSVMPQDLVSVIKKVKKYTWTSNTNSSIDTTTDDLFLMSQVEVARDVFVYNTGEGDLYKIFENGGSRIKYYSNTARDYWLRSPMKNYDGSFSVISTNGNVSDKFQTESAYIVLCCCI